MGNPIRPRKKYKTPAHPWQGSRIEQEKIIKKEYGLKNKTEIWRFQSLLRKYTSHAKKLIGTKTAQSEKEKEQLLNRLFKLKIIEKDTKIEDVLDLNVNDFLDRRLLWTNDDSDRLWSICYPMQLSLPLREVR